MKQFLTALYDNGDIELIEDAFDIRNDLQYYPNKLVENSKLENVKRSAVDFFVKTKDILTKISEKQIKEIRKKLERK